MSVVFKRCQELTRADGLNIFLKKRDGTPKNAAEISYEIYDFTTGVEILVPPTGRKPQNPAVGEYFAAFRIPPDANIGNYRIRWRFREFVNSKQAEILQEFAIVGNSQQVVTVPGVTPAELDLIRGLRIMLRDGNPDRNYMYAPPSSEASVDQFTRVFGYIWQDEELKEFLNVSLASINSFAPQTFYDSLDQLMLQHRNWRTLLFTGAMVHAINAVALNWIQGEFDYAIGGVSLNLEKSGKYQSMANDAQTRFTDMVTACKETVKIIRGLKQSRYGLGIRSSFGPSVGRGSLTPRRFLGI